MIRLSPSPVFAQNINHSLSHPLVGSVMDQYMINGMEVIKKSEGEEFQLQSKEKRKGNIPFKSQ